MKGNYYLIKRYGDWEEYYVTDVADGFVKICMASWLNDDGMWVEVDGDAWTSAKFLAKGIFNPLAIFPLIGRLLPKYVRLWR